MDNTEQIISAADNMAHECATIAGEFDLVGARDLDSLVSHCRRCYERLYKAAGEYWTAKGLGVDEQSKY